MNRLLIISTLLIAGILNVSAQETQIDLSKFKLPEIKRQTLEFGFNLGNSSFKYDYTMGSIPENMSQNSLGSQLYLNYSYYRNSKQWQNELFGRISFSGQYRDRKEDEAFLYEQHYFSNIISLSSENRYYIDKIFVGINPYLNSRYYYQNYVNTNRMRDAQLDIYIPLHVGYGRIERVEDARQAAYIYNALLEKAKAKEGKTEDDLLMLAEKISQLKNERFFDARDKRTYELEELDKFLKENGYVDEDDITYFATLSDMWSYGNAPIRESGFRGSFFVNPGYTIMDRYYSEANNYNYKSYILKTGINLSYERPLNMYWQYSANMDAYYGLERGRFNYWGYSNSKTPGVNLALLNSIGYYPNTRTSVSMFSLVELAKYFDRSEDGIGSMKGRSLWFSAGLNAYYYFSPQFRVSGNLGLSYWAFAQGYGFTEVYYVPSSDIDWRSNGWGGTKNQLDYTLSLKLEYFLF